MKLISECLIVGCGGMAGSICRYLLTILARHLSFTFPLGTLMVNIIGCFIVGMIGQLVSSGVSLSPHVRLAIVAGFCGGFTTMSSFAYETNEFVHSGEHFLAVTNFVSTLICSFLALYVGIMIVKLKFGA